MSTPKFPLSIDQGGSFTTTFNWYGGGMFMAPIEEIRVGYPTIIKVTGHGLPQVSDTPMILSGIDGADILNSVEHTIEEAHWEDADHFSMPVSTVKDVWVTGSGECTYHMPVPDLETYTAKMHIREKWHSPDFIHELTTENGGITLTTDDASILLIIDATDTLAFTFNQAHYDIDLIDSGGIVTRFAEGIVTLNKGITR
jgi:hypothetical protein